MKKKCAVIFAATADYIFAVANMIIGLNKHSPKLADEYIIFHNDFSRDDQEKLKSLDNRCTFRHYSTEYVLSRIGLESNYLYQLLTRYSHSLFAKFEMFDLLKDFNSVLYLDSDMLVTSDISAIFDYEPMAWRTARDPVYEKMSCSMEGFSDIPASAICPNGGLVFVTDKLQFEGMTDDIYKIAAQLIASERCATIDETAYGIVCSRKNIAVKSLPLTYNDPGKANKAIIHHAMGLHKFWNNSLMMLFYPEWQHNNEKWESLGGRQYQGEISGLKAFPLEYSKIYKKWRNYERWTMLYNSIKFKIPSFLLPNFNNFSEIIYFDMKGMDKKIRYGIKLMKGKYLIFIRVYDSNLYNSPDKKQKWIENASKFSDYQYEPEETENYLSLSYKSDKTELADALTKLVRSSFLDAYVLCGKKIPQEIDTSFASQ